MTKCTACPKSCETDRLNRKLTPCRVGEHVRVAGYYPHKGEEACITGTTGSGTIFFSGCSLGCVFCHSQEISHAAEGSKFTPEQLASVMLELQAAGCVNVNLVTPSHVLPQIYEAWSQAKLRGLTVPVVYNSSGYDSVPALRHVDGMVGVYLPDLKTMSNDKSWKWFKTHFYPSMAREAIREMHRQVGDLVIDPDGIARRGLLVRHLVMPGATADAYAVMSWLASQFPGTAVSIMSTYRPTLKEPNDPAVVDIARRPTKKEHEDVVARARELGLRVVSAR